MEKKSIPVVKTTKKNCCHVDCPFCEYSHYIPASMEKQISEEVFEGDGFTKIIRTMKAETECRHCGRKFVIDYGKSIYTLYDPLVTKNGSDKIFADYHSDWDYDFKIIARTSAKGEEAYLVCSEFKNITSQISDPHSSLSDDWKDPDKINANIKVIR